MEGVYNLYINHTLLNTQEIYIKEVILDWVSLNNERIN
jgi:hypothetical protein